MLSTTPPRRILDQPGIPHHCIQVHTGQWHENRLRYTAQSILTRFGIYHLPSVIEARDIIAWDMGDAFYE